MKSILLTLITMSLAFSFSQAEDIHGIENHGVIGYSPKAERVGQTFEAPESGVINSISVVIPQRGIGDWHLYLGVEPGNGNLLPGAPYQAFTISTLGVITITLSSPFPIEAGTVYRFEVIPQASFPLPDYRINVFHPSWTGSDFSGGHETYKGDYFDGTGLLNDLDFGVSYTPSPTTSIPTMSEWGLVFLFLAFVSGAGAWMYNRKRKESIA